MSDASGESKPISRRDFLKLAGAGVAGGIAIALGLEFNPNYQEQSKQIIDFLDHEYNLQVENGIPAGLGNYNDKSLKPYPLNIQLRKLVPEVFKYPKHIFKNNGLKFIYLGSNSANKAVTENKAILLNADTDVLTELLASKGDIFNHEAFHIFDENDRGFKPDDDLWFSYHDEICNPYTADDQPKNELPQCGGKYYVFPYEANWRASEDRAFWAMRMMNPISHCLLKHKIENTDDKKLKNIREAKYDDIKSKYAHFSQNLMSEQYWQDLMANKVELGYFS